MFFFHLCRCDAEIVIDNLFKVKKIIQTNKMFKIVCFISHFDINFNYHMIYIFRFLMQTTQVRKYLLQNQIYGEKLGLLI